MLEPPGTMRTPEFAVKCFGGNVFLSKKGSCRAPAAAPRDISTVAPIRNPSRMPFFTQALTRQPFGALASGSAARTSPALSASLNCRNNATCFSEYEPGFSSKSRSISACSISLPDQADAFEHAANLCHVLHLWRDERQAPDGLKQTHRSHGGFHGNRIRFDEVHLHQREEAPVNFARGLEIVRSTEMRELSHFSGNFIRYNRDYSTPAERHQRHRHGIVA